jgi:hypothetical protein
MLVPKFDDVILFKNEILCALEAVLERDLYKN